MTTDTRCGNCSACYLNTGPCTTPSGVAEPADERAAHAGILEIVRNYGHAREDGDDDLASKWIRDLIAALAASQAASHSAPAEPVYQIKLHADSPATWLDATKKSFDMHTLGKRIVYSHPVGAEVAPWTDAEGQPIRHGDTLRHPADGSTFVAVRLPGYPNESDAWRAVYDGESTPSRLCLQIEDKGCAVVVGASPARAPADTACDICGFPTSGQKRHTHCSNVD